MTDVIDQRPVVVTHEQEIVYVETLNGRNGLSAYQIAVINGFVGTEAQWLNSLKGANGSGATQHIFSFGDVAQSTLVTIAPNSIVFRVDVVITTPFNGSGFNLTVGDAGDNARLFSDIDMSVAATYTTTPGYKYLSSTPINSYLTVDNTTTQGNGLILVYISE